MTEELRIGTGPVVGVLELTGLHTEIVGTLMAPDGMPLVPAPFEFTCQAGMDDAAPFLDFVARRVAAHVSVSTDQLGEYRDRLAPGSLLVVCGRDLSIVIDEVPAVTRYLEHMAVFGMPEHIFQADENAIIVETEGVGFPMALALVPSGRLYAVNLGAHTEDAVRRHNNQVNQMQGSPLNDALPKLSEQVVLLPMALEHACDTDLSFAELRSLSPQAAEAKIVEYFWTAIAPSEGDDEILRFRDPRYVLQSDSRLYDRCNPDDIDAIEVEHEAALEAEVTCSAGTIREALELLELALGIAATYMRDRKEDEANDIEAQPDARLGYVLNGEVFGTLATAFDGDEATFAYDGPGAQSIQAIFALIRDQMRPEGSCVADAISNRHNGILWGPVTFEPRVLWFLSRSAHERIANEDKLRNRLMQTFGIAGEAADAILAGLAAPGALEA